MNATEERHPATTYMGMWLAIAGLAAAVVVTFLVTPRAGCLVIAGELVVLAAVRAVVKAPLYGIAARSRIFDSVLLAVCGIVMGVFALTAQNM